jgi:putative inorganic carbon (hco3(-)) transporter
MALSWLLPEKSNVSGLQSLVYSLWSTVSGLRSPVSGLRSSVYSLNMSFIFLLLYIFAIYIRPQEWLPAVYGWPMIDILAIGTAVCLLFEASMRGWARIKEAPNMLLLAFFGCVLMSHISHTYFQGMTDSFSKFLPNVILFFLFVNVLTTERRLKIAVWLIILITLFLAIDGIHQFHTGAGFAGDTIMQYTEDGNVMRRIKWIGIFEDPNDLALAFMIGAGFLIAFVFGKSNFFIKIISAGMLAVIMQALYYTNSRGGFLAMGATVGFYFLSRMKNKTLGVTIAVILGLAVVLLGPSRMSQLSAQEDSAFGRIDSWYEGFQMLKSAPLFGVGYGMWGDYHSLGAHNSYILVAAEEGLIGLYFWIGTIYMAFMGLSKCLKNRISVGFIFFGTLVYIAVLCNSGVSLCLCLSLFKARRLCVYR